MSTKMAAPTATRTDWCAGRRCAAGTAARSRSPHPNTAATLWGSAAVGASAGADLILEAALGCLFVLASNTLLRPLVNRINQQPIDTPAVEVTTTVYAIAPRPRQKEALRLLEDALEASNHPTRDLVVHAFGAHDVEIEAVLMSTSVDGDQLDRIVAQLRDAGASQRSGDRQQRPQWTANSGLRLVPAAFVLSRHRPNASDAIRAAVRATRVPSTAFHATDAPATRGLANLHSSPAALHTPAEARRRRVRAHSRREGAVSQPRCLASRCQCRRRHGPALHLKPRWQRQPGGLLPGSFP